MRKIIYYGSLSIALSLLNACKEQQRKSSFESKGIQEESSLSEAEIDATLDAIKMEEQFEAEYNQQMDALDLEELMQEAESLERKYEMLLTLYKNSELSYYEDIYFWYKYNAKERGAPPKYDHSIYFELFQVCEELEETLSVLLTEYLEKDAPEHTRLESLKLAATDILDAGVPFPMNALAELLKVIESDKYKKFEEGVILDSRKLLQRK